MAEELAAEVAAAIGSAYDYPEPLSCRFLRQGFNDHYRAEAGGTEYHVRLYLDGKYYIAGDDDLRAELRLTASLADARRAASSARRRFSGGGRDRAAG